VKSGFFPDYIHAYFYTRKKKDLLQVHLKNLLAALDWCCDEKGKISKQKKVKTYEKAIR
jgi:hypothetical protein